MHDVYKIFNIQLIFSYEQIKILLYNCVEHKRDTNQ